MQFKDLAYDQPYLITLRGRFCFCSTLRGKLKDLLRDVQVISASFIVAEVSQVFFRAEDKIAEHTGDKIQGDDDDRLSELYSTNDSVVTLKQLSHISNIYRSDTLRQVVLCLPQRMHDK